MFTKTKTLLLLVTSLASVSLFADATFAQFPTPAPEHKILKMDVGTWKAEIKTWSGPDGKADPNAEPMSSTGTEVNKMLGEFWVMSDFEGNFGGMEFRGHAVSGYDPKLKKYVASWTDNVSPSAMHMIGSYNADKKEFTYDTKGVGMDGEEMLGKSVTTYVDDDHRTMVMYEMHDGKPVKSMEITYTRTK